MTFVPVAGAIIGAKYRLDRAIAEGGMGSVWLATHVQLETPAAVKFMHAALGRDLVMRFEREAKACARLNSPHIVKVHDFGAVDGVPFMVMEYLEGENASERLRRAGPFSLEAAAELMDAIGKGLSLAHEAGIIHRDLKPANVFFARVGKDEVAKIVDFGIAREAARNAEDRTETGIVLGSPHHMSPEQAGGLDVDGRSDAWSAGVLLYQLLTGKRPFDGTGLSAVLYAIATTTPAPPSTVRPGLPAAVDTFFAKALERDPARRFQAIDEMARAFRAAIVGAPAHTSPALVAGAGVVGNAAADPVTPMPTGSQVLRGLAGAAPPVRRTRGPLAVVAISAVVAGVSGAFLLTRGQTHDTATEPAALPPTVVAVDIMPTPSVVVEIVPTPSAPAMTASASSAPSARATAVAPSTERSPSSLSGPCPPNMTRDPFTMRCAAVPVAPAEPPRTGCPPGKARDPFTGLCASK